MNCSGGGAGGGGGGARERPAVLFQCGEAASRVKDRAVISLFRDRGWDVSLQGAAGNLEGRSAIIDIPLDGPVSARVDPERRQVFLCGVAGEPPDTLAHYACDLLLPQLLAHDGFLVLHAGTVVGPRGALGFIGPSGAGKSTLAAAFQRRGFDLLSDDVALLHLSAAQPSVESLYPSLRLRPDSIARLRPGAHGSEPVAHYSDKLRLSVSCVAGSAPLAALFLLEPSGLGSHIGCRRLEPGEAVLAILANGFALQPRDRREAESKFRQASRAAELVPVFALRYPHDYDALERIEAEILEAAWKKADGN